MNVDLAMLPSRYQIGTAVWFHPAIRTLNLGALYDVALRAEVVGVHFIEGKVMYDLALDIGTVETPDYYKTIPLAQVDSFFVKSKEDLLADNGLAGAEVATASSEVRSSQVVRQFAQRYQEIRSDLPVLRKELGRG